MATEEKVFAPEIEEDAVLESLGYQQELKRSFGLLGMIGFSFSIVTSWSALGGVLIVGVESGGPPVMIWSWIGISVFSLAVAYSMAEICSAYPVAGGQYSWVAIMAPPKMARGLSWVTGWFMIIGRAPFRLPIFDAETTPNIRDSRNGRDKQLHRNQLHPGASQSIFPRLYNRALAHSACVLSDCFHYHSH